MTPDRQAAIMIKNNPHTGQVFASSRAAEVCMMTQQILYIHGKGGNAEEAAHYRPLFPGCRVIGFDYRAQTPWEASDEFPCLYDRYCRDHAAVTLIANSIGAYFAMCALSEKPIARALFISPIVDMARLITDMMSWAQVTEESLEKQKTIPTAFGETLSWDYLCYVREHPPAWSVPTRILYGGRDTLTSRKTIDAFSARTGASLTVMEDGGHWFHTAEQLAFLDRWIREGSDP